MGCAGLHKSALLILCCVFSGFECQPSMPPQQTTMRAMAPQLNPGSLAVALARQRAGMKSMMPQDNGPMQGQFNSGFGQGFQAQGLQTPQSFPPGGSAYRNSNDFSIPIQTGMGNNQFMRPGAPAAPGTPGYPSDPATPARPFLNKLGEMLSNILGGGLRAFGSAIRSVTGTGGTTVFSGILGMMGYAGPYGYDPFGPGQSMDPYAQAMPETNSCYQLLETWLRQCSAQPEAFLEIVSVSSPKGEKVTSEEGKTEKDNDKELKEEKDTNQTKEDEVKLQISISKTGVEILRSNNTIVDKIPPTSECDEFVSLLESGQFDIERGAPQVALSPEARNHALHLINQINQYSNKQHGDSFSSTFPSPSTTIPNLLAPNDFAGLGSRPSAPLAPNPNARPDTPAPPQRPGMFDQIASGAGMNPALGGMVSQTLGPDTYNPWVADGAEPDEFQISGPEKCTRMMNNWLYKCALSPM